ncbi:MAG: hypothetical protein JXA77_15485 [Bacteroidales bacterium]|nr:hypothetical protein [Bacteroidales bacterium]MBN2817907.1 hypothetical protein [Bacteroidales bacterium]
MPSWLDKINADPLEWLLNSNPWTRYRTLTNLLDYSEEHPEVIKTRKDLIEHEKIIKLAKETHEWITVAPTRNNDPKICYYKLRMLADFGLKHTDLGLNKTISKATAHIIDGMFAARGTVPERPKKGQKYENPDLSADVWHSSPCNSPLITYVLLALGYQNKQVLESIDVLKNRWNSKSGWFCHFFFVESQFKKLQIGCPIAGLMALDVFSLIAGLKNSEFAKNAFEPLKFHYEFGNTLYYFGRSKKFWSFKYPFVWYNALYLADVLTRYPIFKEEALVKELINWILESQTSDGKFKPTSIYMEYKGWDFGNKKEVSPWISFLCYRILKQYFELE